MQSVGVPRGRELIAKITLELPADHFGLQFHVLVNPRGNARNIGFNDPSFAGSITPSAVTLAPTPCPGPLAFDVPLTGAISKLRAADDWDDSKPINIQVVPDTSGITAKPFSVPIKSITLSSI